ncbi:hypothetical protein LSH36_300g04081 [Paralvinella palmiformis]|uniref:Ion transport domain-containing protein n=1 Tax=Paralvinella palmiformis TaxID=53620 RepID=A0AAD9JI02_9ANNE|nr:hypothetical protein LSH36_300g04081 [Paralvinella palmiformis]
MEKSISLDGVNRKRVSESVNELVSRVIEEIKHVVNDNLARHTDNTLFFRFVTGGNVTIAREIIRCLHSEELKRELSWATGKPTEDEVAEHYRLLEQVTRTSQLIRKWLCFVVFFVLFVATSPVFYGLHAIFWELGARRRVKSDSCSIKLPLVYALLSEDRDMVKLFLDSGCPVSKQDADGNNVYHYLARISADDSQKAIRCHEILKSACEDVDALKYVVTAQENKMRFTAWEYTAKYGSLLLCCKLANDKCGFGEPVLCVSRDVLWAKLTEHEELGYPAEGKFNVWQFDSTKYESGSAYSRQSYPLHLIVSRAVETLQEADINAVLASDFITKWMSEKVSKYLLPCIFSHLVGLTITFLFLVHLIWHVGNMDLTPLYAATFMKEGYAHELHRISDEVVRENRSWPSDQMTVSQYEIYSQHQLINQMQKVCMERCRCNTSLTDILSDVVTGVDDTDRPTSGVQLALNLIVGICVVQDLYCRLVFLLNNYNWSADTWQGATLPVLFKRLPGSYTDRQLNSFMYFLYGAGILLGHLYLSTANEGALQRTTFYSKAIRFSTGDPHNETARGLHDQADVVMGVFERQEFLSAVISKIIIICLLLRFVQTIYALRLVPNIGFFVITAKKMANTLLQFAVVFVIVLLAFGTIFYFIMRQPKCPAEKMDGFQSLASSLFSAYQTSLGYGSHHFSVHLNARLAYVAFTVIAVLLLLNLVIAVMTTTVEHMNQMPWKVMLISFELWDEILGIEAVFLALTSPCRRIFKCKKTPKSSEKTTTFEIVQWPNGTF